MREIRIMARGSVIVAMNFENGVRSGVWICCIRARVAVSIVMVLVAMEY